jgi:alpha-maltose-1-phosphate synthase
LAVTIVRNEDLESRELLMFDRLHQLGTIRARAVGARPQTPYGIGQMSFPVDVLPSLPSLLARLPMGRTVEERIERRLGRPVGQLVGFNRALGSGVEVINARETFQASTLLACRYRDAHPDTRVVVSVFENIPFRYEESRIIAGVKDEVRGKADLFVANTPEASQALQLEGVPVDRIRVIPPGVDTDLFSATARSSSRRAQWGASEERGVILYAGRMVREKGLVELLIALAPVLAGDGPRRPILVLHGRGPEEPRLRRAVAALGLGQAVHFSPWVETASMPEVYASADVVVLPSLPTPYWAEQFGFNLVEAMSCGCAVVATRSGSIPSVVGDSAQLVVPYAPEALCAAVEELISTPERRQALGRAARQRATDTYAVSRAGADLVEAFHEARHLAPRP